MFTQPPPRLGNQYDDDRALRSYLRRALPTEVLNDIETSLRTLGAMAGGELYRMQLADRLNEPMLTQWNAWGERIDQIEVSPLWRVAERIAAEHGLIATAYERFHGAHSRLHQAALAYLFTPATDIYSCPLAMTDGAARTLLASENQTLIERIVPHLITRDPVEFWTSGQWMTELPGGSDVSHTETEARRDVDGGWRLHGRKWFTSATTSQIAITLARPAGNPEGSRGLALFLVDTRDERGRLRNIEVNRLKDKLGTRKVPTAELKLDGTPAELICGESDGVRNLTPMLNITRLWNGISAASLMRRGVALARDYATRRVAFGAPIAEKPLHVDTLAGLEAEANGAMHLAFFVAALVGRSECNELDEQGALLLRFATPLMKLSTARSCVATCSEVLEAFGGAGYVEDSGLPVLLRDAQVLSIWEGTTNVLSLDALRALGTNGEAFAALRAEAERRLSTVTDARLSSVANSLRSALDHAAAWLKEASSAGQPALEAGARRFAMTTARALTLALMAEQAAWSLRVESDEVPAAAARRYAANGVNLIRDIDGNDSRLLAVSC